MSTDPIYDDEFEFEVVQPFDITPPDARPIRLDAGRYRAIRRPPSENGRWFDIWTANGGGNERQIALAGLGMDAEGKLRIS